MKKKIITFVGSKEDWAWFLRGLDQEARTDLVHYGEPDAYPCLIESKVWAKTVQHGDVTARELPRFQKARA